MNKGSIGPSDGAPHRDDWDGLSKAKMQEEYLSGPSKPRIDPELSALQRAGQKSAASPESPQKRLAPLPKDVGGDAKARQAEFIVDADQVKGPPGVKACVGYHRVGGSVAITLPNSVKEGFYAYLDTLTEDKANAYRSHRDMMFAVANEVAELLIASNDDPGSQALLNYIFDKAKGKPCPALVVKNGPNTPVETILPKPGDPVPRETDDPPRHSYWSPSNDLEGSEIDRGYKGFTVENWILALGALLGQQPDVNPNLYPYNGKGHPFDHIKEKRNRGAAEGGTTTSGLSLHNDYPERTRYKNELEADAAYAKLGVNYERAKTEMGKTKAQIIADAVTLSYTNAGAPGPATGLMLCNAGAGVNTTPTSFLTGEQIKEHIINNLGQKTFDAILEMNIAFTADYSVGNGSGIASIGRMMTEDGKVKYSGFSGEMTYVGHVGESDEAFAEKKRILANVIASVEECRRESALLDPGDTLFVKNNEAVHGRGSFKNGNVGTEAATAEDYREMRDLLRAFQVDIPDDIRNIPPDNTSGYRSVMDKIAAHSGNKR